MHGIDSDPYIDGLLQGLNLDENLEIWASLNPMEYLPRPDAEANSVFHRVLFSLALIRNALVFSPVALTWFAISKATSAFSAYTTDNSLTVVNFLDFWENGYGVLSKSWSLSRVATLDFQIILVIISLTVGIGFFEKKLKSKKEIELGEIDNERVKIAVAIVTLLHKQKRITPQIFNSASTGILRNLVNTSRNMERTAKEFNKTFKTLPSQIEILKEIKKIKLQVSRNSE
jgi:hypothetical protein